MIKAILFILVLSRMASPGFVAAQGCSDAGICSLPAFKASQKNAPGNRPNTIRIGMSAGGADHSITAFGADLDYSHTWGSSWMLDTRITFLSQTGNNISIAGPGDVYLNLGYRVSGKVTLTGGVKLPLADGNAYHKGLPLPMDYQSSLGSVDLILGAGFTYDTWQVLFGWQQPLSDNENRFDASLYSSESPLSTFQSTNGFRRKGDMLLRLTYPVTVSDKITFTPSLLPIYHLGADEYTDDGGFAPVRRSIEGSDGLTINATFQFNIAMSGKSALQFNIGVPLLVRKVRPDGLTRGFVLQALYGLSW